MKSITTSLSLLFLFTAIGSFAQKSSIPGEIRYISYPNIPKNKLLYDTVDTYGFYSIVQSSFRAGSRVSDSIVKGISAGDLQRLRSVISLREVRGLEFRLGLQATTPLANSRGEDSVVFLPDGTTAYLYPARDSIYTVTCNFDEIVIREELVTDSVNGKRIYRPVELMLMKRFKGLDKPIVTARMDFQWMYLLNAEFVSALPKQESDLLIGKMEAYFASGVKEFGGYGYSQLVKYRHFYFWSFDRVFDL